MDLYENTAGKFDVVGEIAYASEHGQEEALRIVLKAGADVNARSSRGLTALFRARFDYAHVVRLLIGAGIDVCARTDRGLTALKSAVF